MKLRNLLCILLLVCSGYLYASKNDRINNTPATSFQESISFKKHEEIQLSRWFSQERNSNRVTFPQRNGYVLLRKEDIISIKVNKLYGGVLLQFWKNNKVAKENCGGTISKIIENLGGDFPFVQVSRSAIVNMNEVSRFSGNRRKAFLEMSDGTTVNVSRRISRTIAEWCVGIDLCR